MFQDGARIQMAGGESGANAPVTVTIPTPQPGGRYYLYSVIASYSAAPTGGQITSTGLVGDELNHAITAAGWGGITFPPLSSEENTGISVTLAAGGAAVVGRLSVCYAEYP